MQKYIKNSINVAVMLAASSIFAFSAHAQTTRAAVKADAAASAGTLPSGAMSSTSQASGPQSKMSSSTSPAAAKANSAASAPTLPRGEMSSTSQASGPMGRMGSSSGKAGMKAEPASNASSVPKGAMSSRDQERGPRPAASAAKP